MKPPRLMLIIAVATAMGGCASLVPAQPELDAQHRLDRGLSALEAGAYPAAFDDLAWVYSNCWGREAATHALLALAALELDPRNERARPSVGTDLLGRAITEPGTPRWARPLVETSFLTALALGAPHPGEPDHARGVEAAPGEPAPAERPEDEHPADEHAEDEHPADEEHAADEPATTAEAALDPPTTGSASGCGRTIDAEGWVAPPLPELPGPSMTDLLARAESRRDSLAIRTDFLQRQLDSALEDLQATRAELERIRRTLNP